LRGNLFLTYNKKEKNMPKFIDLTGQKFGRLMVIKRAPNKNNRTAWLCECECGK
jgi:hypothetical protein